jgi:hypothetical protein
MRHSFIWYNARSQHSLFDEVLEADEHADLDHHEDLAKAKFTFTECMIALVLSLVIVTLLAYFGVPDQFLGLIMLPLVEKAAEHLTAIDEAWDGQIVRKDPPITETQLMDIEFCSLPLHRSFHPNCALQRPACCHRRMDDGQGYGFKFRDLHDRAARPFNRRCW